MMAVMEEMFHQWIKQDVLDLLPRSRNLAMKEILRKAESEELKVHHDDLTITNHPDLSSSLSMESKEGY